MPESSKSLNPLRPKSIERSRSRAKIEVRDESALPELQTERIFKIVEIVKGSPADEAGLHPGDSIIFFQGKPLPSDKLLQELAGDGKTYAFTVKGSSGEAEVLIKPQWNEIDGLWSTGIKYIPTHLLKTSVEEEAGEGRVRFEYRTIDGKSVVRGYADIGLEEFSSKENKAERKNGRREVKKCVLLIEKDNRQEEFDLLKRFNTTGTKVYWQSDIDSSMYSPQERAVLLKEIEGPDAIHTLLHELRHAYQDKEGLFSEVWPYYASLDDDDHIYTAEIQAGVEKLRKIVSEIFSTEDDVENVLAPFLEDWGRKNNAYRNAELSLRELRDQRERLADLIETQTRERDLRDSLGLGERSEPAGEKAPMEMSSETDLGILDEQIVDAEYELAAAINALPTAGTPVIGSVTVREIFKLPTLLIERDAEYGALVSLRTIRKETGINLLDQFINWQLVRKMPPMTENNAGNRIRKYIDSLILIRDYMDRIGVPFGCVREMKAELKKKNNPKNLCSAV
jgi:hypothetical protein